MSAAQGRESGEYVARTRGRERLARSASADAAFNVVRRERREPQLSLPFPQRNTRRLCFNVARRDFAGASVQAGAILAGDGPCFNVARRERRDQRA